MSSSSSNDRTRPADIDASTKAKKSKLAPAKAKITAPPLDESSSELSDPPDTPTSDTVEVNCLKKDRTILQSTLLII